MHNRLAVQDILDIYRSCEHMNLIAEKYNITRYNVITIKRKIHYTSVTKNLTELPGYCPEDTGKGKNRPIPVDLIPKIYMDEGTYEYFWEKYGASRNVVLSIKGRKTNTHLTENLGEPGHIKRYNLSNDDLEQIHSSELSNKQLAEQFNVCQHTIQNIRTGRTRGIFYDDFE